MAVVNAVKVDFTRKVVLAMDSIAAKVGIYYCAAIKKMGKSKIKIGAHTNVTEHFVQSY